MKRSLVVDDTYIVGHQRYIEICVEHIDQLWCDLLDVNELYQDIGWDHQILMKHEEVYRK